MGYGRRIRLRCGEARGIEDGVRARWKERWRWGRKPWLIELRMGWDGFSYFTKVFRFQSIWSRRRRNPSRVGDGEFGLRRYRQSDTVLHRLFMNRIRMAFKKFTCIYCSNVNSLKISCVPDLNLFLSDC
jgi:hypothetical protein